MTLSKINAAINGAVHKPSLNKAGAITIARLARPSQVMHGNGHSLSGNRVYR
ncbi:hypothetical protein [Lysobacter capsici]|uniref:hypothetical protein n=1 Tax=Lysobacter capsici TaxID=435897 RepID=UPI001C004615|nr:hypothetical protein [Lysobacter capsici]QWF14825.1 hypothetical protein KME82_13460 [Lysobacter capsici]